MPWASFREELMARLSPNAQAEVAKLNLGSHQDRDLSRLLKGDSLPGSPARSRSGRALYLCC